MIGRGGALEFDVPRVVSGLPNRNRKRKRKRKARKSGPHVQVAQQRSQRACKLGFIGAGELGKLCRRMRQITWLNCPTIEPVL